MHKNMSYQKRVLTKDVINPEPKGLPRQNPILNRILIPKGTIITVAEWDPDADIVKKVYGQDIADLTPAQMACIREGQITVHPDSYDGVVNMATHIGKAQRLYAMLIEASEPVDQTLVDWAFAHYHPAYQPSEAVINLIRILGKVLQAATSVDACLPVLLGIDQNIDDLVKRLLSKPKPTTRDTDEDTKNPSGHRPSET